MREGQTVEFHDEDGEVHAATIIAVAGGDTPGPRVLTLTVNEAEISEVEHVSARPVRNGQPETPYWSESGK